LEQDALRAEELTVAEKQKHMEVALRYTLPVPKDKVDEDLISEMAAVVGEVLKSVDGGDELLAAIYDGWKPVIAKRM